MSNVRSPTATGLDELREPALHIGDAATLARRAPTMEVPSVGRRVWVPPTRGAPHQPGTLALESLLLPQGPSMVRFALPADIESGLGMIWRSCPVTGLDLPINVAAEAWFRKNAGVEIFVSPTSIGLNESAETLASVAWWLLSQFDRERLAHALLNLGFRIDASGQDGPHSIDLAEMLADRWMIGHGLFHAALCGRTWLNPRCLRWIVRELATADAALRSGTEVRITLGPATPTRP